MTTVVRWKTVRFGACAQEIRNAHSHAPLRPLEHTRQKSVIMQVAMIFSKPFLLESRQPEEYQKMRSIRICPAALSKWDRRMQMRSGICPPALSKWDRVCEKMLCSSASQVRSGIWPAMLSKWDRVPGNLSCQKKLKRTTVIAF